MAAKRARTRKAMAPKAKRAAPRRGMSKTAAKRLGKVPVRSAKGAADPSKTPRTTSTFGPRLEATRQELGAMLQSRFAKVEPTFAWNMHGWRIRRPTDIRSWTGTIDPNWILVGIAERRQGMSIHVWNPYDPGCLKKSEPRLKAAGYNVMVGCVNYNRQGDVPLRALAPILDGMRDAMRKEAS